MGIPYLRRWAAVDVGRSLHEQVSWRGAPASEAVLRPRPRTASTGRTVSPEAWP